MQRKMSGKWAENERKICGKYDGAMYVPAGYNEPVPLPRTEARNAECIWLVVVELGAPRQSKRRKGVFQSFHFFETLLNVPQAPLVVWTR